MLKTWLGAIEGHVLFFLVHLFDLVWLLFLQNSKVLLNEYSYFTNYQQFSKPCLIYILPCVEDSLDTLMWLVILYRESDFSFLFRFFFFVHLL